ncbi:MAG: NUDIX hydrolase [Candidatus Kerfeldbacteria bacterium]|nr:NUDIX hydrolase [Candidatus Kerfeldbacteria bacterium]
MNSPAIHPVTTIIAKAVIRRDGRLLVMRHAQGHVDLPGGRLRTGEDLLDGLRRELHEELGLEQCQVDERPLFAWNWFSAGANLNVVGVAFGVSVAEEQTLKNREREIVIWVRRSDFHRITFAPQHRPSYLKYLTASWVGVQ